MSKIKQTIYYTNGKTRVKYFENAREELVNSAITLCSPVVKNVKSEKVEEE